MRDRQTTMCEELLALNTKNAQTSNFSCSIHFITLVFHVSQKMASLDHILTTSLSLADFHFEK